ncbi:hypothetical protein LTR08_003556 [Meristemomyces frigidus]|nr:hypothetical protein LTR08_003556 [Meristemomyces frigidus]
MRALLSFFVVTAGLFGNAIGASSVNQTTSAGAAGNATLLQPLFPAHSNSTPRFHNISGVTANPLIKALQSIAGVKNTLAKRQSSGNGLPTGTCAPGTPCSNGACCSNTGICGYSPSQCGSSVCISNCNATAECGQYAPTGNQMCPLNVCCSNFGFCGTTDDFCNTDTSTPCQQGYGTCGPPPVPSCGGGSSTNGRTVGYYEGWSSTRICDSRLPDDLDLTTLTHINFAFVFFSPTTFQITPMDQGDPALYSKFTALKSKKPSLKTWVSVGGWSFTDATNTPNTQTAFSDMVGSAANRQTFITSLQQFMTSYGFDGVDLDWEYPGAPDRGGIPADTANYVTFLKELRAAFGSGLGISTTIPSSFWYLQWFDVSSMQNYIDWFNFMSYDIHGIWDSTDQYTGPYIEPHTNWTEIEQGLDLLWTAGVSPSSVNLGIGWYGRSFTLANPSCNTPGCVFTAGGNPGPCTNSSGTLSNAEINLIISQNDLTPTFDNVAAVNWITWGSNQWVSYDNGPSIQLKLQRANQLCLGGTMIWSMDMDDSSDTSTLDFLGIGTSSGVSVLVADAIMTGAADAQAAAAVEDSCYWSLCGDSCTVDYFPVAQGTGQIGGVTANTICPSGQAQTLCCAPGTTMGTCEWDGFRGVGLPCSATCSNSNAIAIAANTNQYQYDADTWLDIDITCTGGYQVYCCQGFKPSPMANTNNLNLIGRSTTVSRKRSVPPSGVTKRQSYVEESNADAFCVGVGNAITSEYSTFDPLDGLADLVAGSIGAVAACLRSAGVLSISGSVAACQQNPNGQAATNQPTIGKPAKIAGQMGQWLKLAYGSNVRNCAVTYSCNYGLGWDEICDNQRWAISKGLGGRTSYDLGGGGVGRSKSSWSARPNHNTFYYSLANTIPPYGGRHRCENDEFPMSALSQAGGVQIVRFVDGGQNGRQGNDFKNWKLAQWAPCSALRKLNNLPPPPVYWAFGTIPQGDPRLAGATTGSHFLQYYGFSYAGQATTCFVKQHTQQSVAFLADKRLYLIMGFALYPTIRKKHPANLKAILKSRSPNCRMTQFFGWPYQDYWNPMTQPVLPGGLGAPQPNYATNLAMGNWIKRQVVQSVLEGKLESDDLLEEFDERLQSATMVVNAHGEEAAILVTPWHDPSSPHPLDAEFVTQIVPDGVESTSAVPAIVKATAGTSAQQTGKAHVSHKLLRGRHHHA